MKLRKNTLIQSMLSFVLLSAVPARAQIATFGDLLHEEEGLEARQAELKQQGVGAGHLTAFFAQHAGEGAALDSAFMHNWLQKQQAFQSSLDRFIVDEQLFFLEEAYRHYQDEVVASKKVENASIFKRGKLQEHARLLEEGYQGYKSQLDLFGENKDYRRINAYVKFFRNYRKLMEGLHLAAKADRSHVAGLQRAMVGVGLKQTGILKHLYFPKKRDTNAHHHTPLLNKESHALRRLMKEMEVDVQVEGRENIPVQHEGEIPDDKVVNIFTVMHSNPFYDEAVKAHLELPHYMIVWAVGVSGLPAFLQETLAHSSSILPVKHGVDTTEMAVQALDNKYSNNIAIHPQGVVTVFNEVMPLHKNFTAKFLETLQERGYKIRLVPITSSYPPVCISGRYYDRAESGPTTMTIKIHKPVEPAVMAELLKDEAGQDVIRHYIRALWLEAMPTDQTQVMGQLRAETIAGKLKELLPSFGA